MVADPGPRQALSGIPGKVEMWPGIRDLAGEEAGALGIPPQELLLEIPTDLVGGLTDAGTDCSLDALPVGS